MCITSAGGNYFTIVSNPNGTNVLYGVGGLVGGSWVPNFANPTFVPVDCVGGDSLGSAYLFVIDNTGTIQTIGASDGTNWGTWNSQIFPALPSGTKPKQFVAFASGYVTVIDTKGAVYTIGNVTGGGAQWVLTQNLNPPT